MRRLTSTQIEALRSFSQPGNYTVGWNHRDYGLTWKLYQEIRDAGLIVERWTNNLIRPEVAITSKGVEALKK